MAWWDLRKLVPTVGPERRLARLGVRPDLLRAAAGMVSDERSDAQVKRLESDLGADESVISVVEGRCGGQLGLLALTTDRILFRPHGGIGAGAEHPLGSIRRVTSALHPMTSALLVELTDGTVTVDKVLGRQAVEFAAAVRDQQINPGPVKIQDPLDALMDLRALRDAGLMTPEEFEARKARLTDQI